MKVLITGGAGFVGRAFVRRLLDDGHTVAVVDNLWSGQERHDWMFQPQSLDNLQLMISDARAWFSAATPGSLWAANRFDLIIHCAAIVDGRIRIEEAPLKVATDLSVDSEFFNWLNECKAFKTKVVYFSSSAIYPLELQTKESHRILVETDINFDANYWYKPDASYGFVKMAGEYLAKFAVEKCGLDVVIYRPFGGCGEDQSLFYPWPAIHKRVIDDHNPVLVWGSGDQQRDFVHISDVVGCVLATKDILKPGEVLNIGTGQATSFFELAERIVKIAGKDLSIRNDVNKPEGVFSRVADAAKMLSMYTPKVSLDQGIKWTLESWKKRVDLRKAEGVV